MGKKFQTEGVKTLTAMSWDRYGKSKITIEQTSGILTAQEVVCAGPEGWHPDRDDVVNFFSDGETVFVEPMGWEKERTLNQKIDMALDRKDINFRREMLDTTFSVPKYDMKKANAEMAARVGRPVVEIGDSHSGIQ